MNVLCIAFNPPEDVVKRVLCDPEILPVITEEGVDVDLSKIPLPDGHEYIVGMLGDTPIAVMIYHPDSLYTWWCHIQVLPLYRKGYADQFMNAAKSYAILCGVKKLIAQVPFCYPNVMTFARKHGFEIEGVNKSSFMHKGKLIDQWYLGLSLAILDKTEE